MFARLAAVAAVTAALAGAGCSRRAKIVVTEISVAHHQAAAGGPASEWSIAEAPMRETIRAALDKDSIGVRLDATNVASPWRCRVEYMVEGSRVDQSAVVHAAVTVRLHRIDTPEEPALEVSGVLERTFENAKARPGPELTLELVRQGMPDLLKDIHSEARLRTAKIAEVQRALDSTDAVERRSAVRVAALRRDATLVPSLIDKLRDADPAVADAAIGALVAIGDQRAVRPLCDLVPLRDREAATLVKVIDAIGAIGGDEARAFLEFVATGHEQPSVRDLAREALQRMQRRAPAR